MSHVVIYASDLLPKHCAWGIRSWWRLHNLDFADFLVNGVSSDVLLATGDALAIEAVRLKISSLERADEQ